MKYPGLPAVEIGARKSYFPMEVLLIEKNQKRVKKTTPEQQAKMINSTKMIPAQKQAEIYRMIQASKVFNPSDESMKECKITVEREMVEVNINFSS